MSKIISDKRPHTPIEDEVWTNKYNYSIGQFIDLAPTDVLLKLYTVISNELLQRYKNTKEFENQFVHTK